MISIILGVYSDLLDHYKVKWYNEKVDLDFHKWEKAQEMRAEMGFDDNTFKKIPKRKIKNNASRKKHGL